MNPSLNDQFASLSLRLTKPRIAVFQTLNGNSEPLSIAQIINQTNSVDRVTIYRTLALFEKLHIVERITTGWKHTYELAEPFKPHHHHLICTSCGSITKIQSDHIEQLITYIAHKHHFQPTAHHFEVCGICEKCQETHQ